MDSIGLWRSDSWLGVSLKSASAVARVPGASSDVEYWFYKASGTPGNALSYRKRTCPKTGACTAGWQAATLTTITFEHDPSIATSGGYLYLSGSVNGQVRVYKFSPSTGDLVAGAGYGVSGDTTSRTSIVEYDGALFVFYRSAGPGSQAVKGLRVNPSTLLTISSVAGSGAMTTDAPTAASGTMDYYSPSPDKGLWVTYSIKHDETDQFGDPVTVRRIAYRRYEPATSSLSAERLAVSGNVWSEGNPGTTGFPAATVWRGKLYLAGRDATGNLRYGYCSLPCQDDSTWTGWPVMEPSAGEGLTLHGGSPVLALWHTPYGSNIASLRQKFGE
jgi:hypothetical protein